jgi:pSer/pThr/pTyr-binding forkhead associated (FHA) protein
VAVILEVKAGPMSGEKIAVRTGETKTFGRVAGRANFALPHDTVMSGVHFSVECGPQGGTVKDNNSTNGTYLNGARVKESPLNNGDEIRTGQTQFLVRLVADEKLSATPQPVAAAPAPAPRPVAPPAPPPPPSMAEQRGTARPEPEFQATPPPMPPVSRREPPPMPVAPAPPPPAARAPLPPKPAPPASSAKPAVFAVGSWAFSTVPQGWDIKAEFGMEHAEKDGFPTTVTATEELVPGNIALGPFVESQLSMLRQYLRDPKIEAAIPPAIPGAEEKASVDVRYSTNDGQIIFYRRIYARSGRVFGTLTLMTLEKELAAVRAALDAVVAGLTFQVKMPA